MKRIPDIYAEKGAAGRPVISIEFFPPKTPQGDESLFERVLPRLAEARPDFCSVTYGAGGAARAPGRCRSSTACSGSTA